MAFNFNLPSITESYANLASFPSTGNSRTLYKALDTTNLYTWNGSIYVLVNKEFASSWGELPATSEIPVVTKDEIGLGNVDNTSDADKPVSTATQTALNAKQATLVSGTNIKTINGESVLGSGDIVVGGGGGGSGLQGAQIQFNNNGGNASFGFNASMIAANTGTVIPTANRLDVYPITPNKTLTNVSLTINVSTLGVSTLARLVVYSNSNSFPTTKLFESTDINCSTTGDKTVLTGLTFTAGTTYWLGFYSNGFATFRTLSATALIPLVWPSATSPVVAWSRISTPLGTAPSTFNINTYSSLGQINILIKQT
jgi:hypothetical protein